MSQWSGTREAPALTYIVEDIAEGVAQCGGQTSFHWAAFRITSGDKIEHVRCQAHYPALAQMLQGRGHIIRHA